ncbi:hypothetical protein CPG38_04275 [Malaciobacter marinus]|uniref:TetR/AcrR family transcriptional regulator n=1 Tax=Malaciobacter marinus TaxID=505249 RepID=UPI000C07EA15|nr:TetR/AcrR family transcriptional regulator [Malaciobacter marinus]PHO13180.1 hypothetical protein CPG38_04275 [Malaciobacter marinus]
MAQKICKHQKRESIAFSCKSLILQEGLSGLTISSLAKEANIGKGTIYEYFENKEDIVLELANILHKEYLDEVYKLAPKKNSIEDKIKVLILTSYEEKFIEYRKIFKELIGVSYYKTNCAFMLFQNQWYKQNYQLLYKYIQKAIKNKEIKENSTIFIDSILSTFVGYFMLSFSKSDLQKTINSIDSYINNLFLMLRV